MIREVPFKFVFFLISAASLALFSSLSFAATTIHVPADQPTIQAGIDAAVDTDTVLVRNGTYTGDGNKNVDFKGKAITVRSENGAEFCIIDCEGIGRGFWFHNSEANDSRLNGFTIQNAYTTYGGGIWCDGVSPYIENCIIKNNEATSKGGGICCTSSASPVVSNCTIENNETSYYGGGVYGENSEAEIKYCTINENSGCGIYLDGYSTPIISACTIFGNEGSGIYCYESTAFISNCVIFNNESTSYRGGGGVVCWRYDPTIINCTITNNTASTRGGGIGCDASDPIIKNCIVWENTGSVLDQISLMQGSTPSVTYSDVEYGFPGEGNLDSNPLFVFPENRDFRLGDGSPCINSATPVGAPDTDINGNPRPYGAGYDMGAHESQGGSQEPNLPPVADAGPDKTVFDTANLDGSGSSDPDGTIVSYQWNLSYRGNSEYDKSGTGVNPIISDLEPGFYDVVLTVTDNNGSKDTDTAVFSSFIGTEGDFNDDGDVDGSDLQIFSTNYGK